MARATAGSGYTMGQHSFAVIPQAQIERSAFDRSCSLKTAFDSGYLVPVFVDEALPGDTFNLRMSSFVRMSTPIYPVLDNLYMDFFFFAVPNRLVWDNWKKFNGEQKNPGDSTDFLVPIMTEHLVSQNSLSDYMGIPPTYIWSGNKSYSSLWHRSYNLIWNEWFRDENLQNSVVVDRDDGPDDIADYVLLRRGKRHDYFSSCLPFPQKGNAVTLPLGSTAPVKGLGFVGTPSGHNAALTLRQTAPLADLASGNAYRIGTGTNANDFYADADGVNSATMKPKIYADLSAATAATINQIRQAFQIQRLLERDARGGSRYTEIVRSHFGVVSPDARMQRPEYLGGGSTRIAVHPVARTVNQGSASTVGPALAQLGAFATAAADGVGFRKSFTEHCLILGLVSVRADLTYQQGMERMFSRRTRYDFYWPALAHTGEQAVLNKEIYCQGSVNPTDDAAVFGYQERYGEYRYKPSRTSGTMRSLSSATPIDNWHLGLKFASLPLLNDTFIQDAPPVDRIVAVTTEKQFYGDFWFQFHCARPMPTFSVPGLIDHF